MRFIGAPPHNGGMRSAQITVPARAIYQVPQTWSAERVVMLEPLGIAVHAVKLAKPKPGESVGVVGCGPIGLLVLQLLRAAGVSDVYAVDPLVRCAVSGRTLHSWMALVRLKLA
jgi:L-iditol 2-dehydrogenase